jgi:hypothetical protein
MIPFESLLVVGIGAAVITVFLFFRWLLHAAMSINLIKRFAVNYFGGMGIGYMIVLALVLGRCTQGRFIVSTLLMQRDPDSYNLIPVAN